MPDRLYQYIGEAEPVLVPPPDFNWFQPPPEGVPRRHPPRQTAGLSWHTDTPLDDYDWEPRTQQPLFRHKRRQAAGMAVWIPQVTVEEDARNAYTWEPRAQQPLFHHKRRQAAGQSFDPEPIPVPAVPAQWFPVSNQPYLRHKRRQTAGATWATYVTPAYGFENVLLVRLIDPSHYPSTAQFYLELHMSTANAAQQARAKLTEVVSGDDVAGSEIGTNATSTDPVDRFRSGPLTLNSDAVEYKIRAGGETGGTYKIYRAAVVAVV